MASFAVGLNAFANYRTAPPIPKVGQDGQVQYEQAFSTTLSFAATTANQSFDLTADDRAYDFSWVSMFVDNSSQNSVPLTIVVAGTGQRIVVKANTQGYYPVIAPARSESAGNLGAQVFAPTAGVQFLVQIMLLNYMVTPFVWPTV